MGGFDEKNSRARSVMHVFDANGIYSRFVRTEKRPIQDSVSLWTQRPFFAGCRDHGPAKDYIGPRVGSLRSFESPSAHRGRLLLQRFLQFSPRILWQSVAIHRKRWSGLSLRGLFKVLRDLSYGVGNPAEQSRFPVEPGVDPAGTTGEFFWIPARLLFVERDDPKSERGLSRGFRQFWRGNWSGCCRLRQLLQGADLFRAGELSVCNFGLWAGKPVRTKSGTDGRQHLPDDPRDDEPSKLSGSATIFWKSSAQLFDNPLSRWDFYAARGTAVSNRGIWKRRPVYRIYHRKCQ